jgi:hypothetical protein
VLQLQLLPLLLLLPPEWYLFTRKFTRKFTCFTSKKVQILTCITAKERRVVVFGSEIKYSGRVVAAQISQAMVGQAERHAIASVNAK